MCVSLIKWNRRGFAPVAAYTFKVHSVRIYPVCVCKKRCNEKSGFWSQRAHTRTWNSAGRASISLFKLVRSLAFPTSIPCTRICSKQHHTLTNFNCILMHFAYCISFSLPSDARFLSRRGSKSWARRAKTCRATTETNFAQCRRQRHVLGKVESKCASGFGPRLCAYRYPPLLMDFDKERFHWLTESCVSRRRLLFWVLKHKNFLVNEIVTSCKEIKRQCSIS